jgi:enoyl-CoA hydratase/carnithine racemase
MDFENLHVSTERHGRVVVVEIDHGKANEMGSAQLREFEALVAMLESSEARALITFSQKRTKRGTPVFVAGANVTERGDWSIEDVKHHVRWQRRILSDLKRVPLFHIGVVAGVALGWGTEFLLTCDYRIAAPGAVFGLPETGLGIVPGAGGTSDLWSHVGVPHALRLGMTGERIQHDEAMRIGLVQETTLDVGSALARARALADMAATRSPTAVGAFKNALLASVGAAADHRAEREARAYEHCVDTGEAAKGREAFAAIRSGEEPQWGARVPWRPL